MALANFQTQVQKYPAKGAPGDKASLNAFHYTDRNYVAESVGDVPVKVGGFVWSSVANDTLTYEGSGVFSAVAVQASASAQLTAPLGIVERNLSYVNYDILDGGTLDVPDNAPLNIVIYGDLYAVATTAATPGQKVFATLADGSIQTGAKSATVSGAVETNWVVTEGGAAGSLITISAWAQTPPAA